ncbi:MAG: MotA/TolQ/ExbB proton channel family protein [Chitinispirillaceae bacterium]|nr:MotA/TolQ/ExbB proton channel family protein [Chitinispirillaceae bacterium]
MYVNRILDFFSRGGYQFMIPLLFLSIIALAVILERIHFLLLCCSISKDHFQSFKIHFQKGEFEEALKLASGKPTLPYTIILSAINMVTHNSGKISLIQSLQKSADRHITWLSKRLWLLKAVAYLSPMLGLLGTVVGLAISFGTIADTGLDQKSVASGISVALITTITGLVIALPTLLAESCLRAWAKVRYDEISALMDDLTIGCDQ